MSNCNPITCADICIHNPPSPANTHIFIPEPVGTLPRTPNLPWNTGGLWPQPSRVPFEDMMKTRRISVAPKTEADITPIDNMLLLRGTIFSKLYKQPDPEDIYKYIWVDANYIMNVVTSSPENNGRWGDGGAYVYVNQDRAVVITCNNVAMAFNRNSCEIHKCDKSPLVVNDDCIALSIMPILLLIAKLCKEKESVQTSNGETATNHSNLTRDVFYKTVDAFCSDDGAVDIMSRCIRQLYNKVEQVLTSGAVITPAPGILILQSPNYQTVTIRINIDEQVISIQAGKTKIAITDLSSSIVQCLPDRTNATAIDVATMLSAIYVWYEANDLLI